MSRTLDNVKELYPEWDNVFKNLYQTESSDDFVLITNFFQPTLEKSINQLNKVKTDMVYYCKVFDRFVRFVKGS
jgi:hypothetical protein